MAAAPRLGLIVREVAISGVINAALSAAFFFALFGLGHPLPVWGAGNFAFDFMPQSLAVAFFASFVPSLLMARAAAAGRLTLAVVQPTLGRLLAKALLRGVVAMIAGGAIWAAVFLAAGVEEIAAMNGLLVKVTYGFGLGGAVTFFSLKRLIDA